MITPRGSVLSWEAVDGIGRISDGRVSGGGGRVSEQSALVERENNQRIGYFEYYSLHRASGEEE
jgi:hypothetical protein